MSAVEPDPYAEIAAWYDLEHDPVTDDIECYQELIGAHAGARATVLEIGSGSGRIAAALALAGHSVTGVEPSAAMRARAVKRLTALPERVARRIRTLAGTATAPQLAPEERFDVILFGCNTFAHLISAAERGAALTTLRRHLQPGGLLLLDVDLAGPQHMAETAGQLWLSGIWPLPESTETVAHLITAGASADSGTLTLLHFYDVWQEGGAVRRTMARMVLAQLDPEDTARSVYDAGYMVFERYGAYDLSDLDDGAPRAILFARASEGDQP
jgi:SAM-dependent methyltransferase